MSAYELLKGATANIPFSTRNRERVLTSADSTPTITGVQLDGTAIATTGFSIVQQQDQTPANITGRYYIRITSVVTGAWTDRSTGQVQLAATIGGFTATEEVNFLVVAGSTAVPYIDVN
jgi:hypothetical protein